MLVLARVSPTLSLTLPLPLTLTLTLILTLTPTLNLTLTRTLTLTPHLAKLVLLGVCFGAADEALTIAASLACPG